jgi:N-acetylmuramoyl-L-alanine amidase
MKTAMASLPSPNCDDRPDRAPIDVLVLHYTGMKTAAEAIQRLCDPAAKVSAHYVIDEAGLVTAMVPEEKRAWHAGQSFWRGERNVNGRSIGIELVNPGHEFGYRDFPAVQMEALRALAKAILARHPIPARNVVGHSDVAPTRKTDPGERFDWAGLAAEGIGLWPADGPPVDVSAARIIDMLARYGYDTADKRAAIAAFQRHFRPTRVDGIADADTAGRLKALLKLCK